MTKIIFSKALIGTLFAIVATSAQSNYRNCTTRCGWYFELEPFYAKGTDMLLTNSIYAIKKADPMILGDNNVDYHLNLKGTWSGRAALGYDFPSCSCYSNSGVSLEYTYFNLSNSASVFTNALDSEMKPALTAAEFLDNVESEGTSHFSNANTKLNQRYGTVDLLAHRDIWLCNCISINTFGGLRFFHLKEEMHNFYSFEGMLSGVAVRNTYKVGFSNETNDIGPHIGVGIFYPIGEGFGVTSELTGSLLYGESSSEYNTAGSLTGGSILSDTPIALTASNHIGDSAHVIPAISGKVGIGYQVVFRNCFSFMMEAGYRGDRYFRAINDAAFQQLLAGTDINSNCNYQDFDLTGPYLSLTVHA